MNYILHKSWTKSRLINISVVNLQSPYSVYWVLFTGVNIYYFHCRLSTMKILQQQIVILHRNLSEQIKNGGLIATQIGPDIENSDTLT